MPAIETVAGSVLFPGASLTALANFSGDSFVVRNYNTAQQAYLISLIRGDTVKGITRVRSPLLHDNVKGYHVATSENPSGWGFPAFPGQILRPQDTLIVEASGATTGLYDIGAITTFYGNLNGPSGRLHNYGDFAGMIRSMVTVEVATTSSATPNWTDTVVTVTDNLLHANTDYAVLGILCDTPISVVAVKGIDTGNLRIGAPGRTTAYDMSNYFVELSARTGLPCIPVFNSANAGSFFVSTADVGASTQSNVTLVLAECGQNTGL